MVVFHRFRWTLNLQLLRMFLMANKTDCLFINIVICNFVMCIIGLFLSFVSVILFVCFNNNICLWRRFARGVLKIFFVFFSLITFSCSSMFLFTMFISLVSQSIDIRVNSRIAHFEVHCYSHLCENHFGSNFVLSYFSFQFQFSENELLFQDLLLCFYLRVFGVHFDCIDLFFVLCHYGRF